MYALDIYTVWATRNEGIESQVPELLVAWDEFSVDDNPDGFERIITAATDAMGKDLNEIRRITIRVPLDTIEAAFRSTVIHGEIA